MEVKTYIVLWKDMLKDDQGDAPMATFDTTIEAHSYIRGIVDVVSMQSGGTNLNDDMKLFDEFKIITLDEYERLHSIKAGKEKSDEIQSK
jgi:hypothetical protein